MYIPMIGVLIILAWGVPELVKRAAVQTAAAVVAVGVCTVVAHAQVEHWADAIALWEHGTRATPDSYIAFENLGQALRERGAYEESIASYEKALALAPPRSPGYLGVIHNSIGLVLTRQAKPVLRSSISRRRCGSVRISSRPAATSATRWRPRDASPRPSSRSGPQSGSAGLYRGAGRPRRRAPEPSEGSEAAPHYAEALRINPNLAEAQ